MAEALVLIPSTTTNNDNGDNVYEGSSQCYVNGGGHHITPSSICSFAAKLSPPVVLGPAARVAPGQTVNYTCKSHGFSSRNITLKWFKDRNELSHFQNTVDPKGESISYSISSTAQVVLSAGDVHSQITCEVAHDTLKKGWLRGTAKLSDIIRGK